MTAEFYKNRLQQALDYLPYGTDRDERRYPVMVTHDVVSVCPKHWLHFEQGSKEPVTSSITLSIRTCSG